MQFWLRFGVRRLIASPGKGENTHLPHSVGASKMDMIATITPSRSTPTEAAQHTQPCHVEKQQENQQQKVAGEEQQELVTKAGITCYTTHCPLLSLSSYPAAFVPILLINCRHVHAHVYCVRL